MNLWIWNLILKLRLPETIEQSMYKLLQTLYQTLTNTWTIYRSFRGNITIFIYCVYHVRLICVPPAFILRYSQQIVQSENHCLDNVNTNGVSKTRLTAMRHGNVIVTHHIVKKTGVYKTQHILSMAHLHHLWYQASVQVTIWFDNITWISSNLSIISG